MADGRHVGKFSKCHNSPINAPTGTQLGWSHPITFSTCPPCCGCHGNGRCLATAHAMNILQLWVHGGRTRKPILMKFGTQQQVKTTTTRDQMLKFLKFKMADGRHDGKLSKCHNSPTNRSTATQLGWSHPIMFSSCPP